MIVVSLLGVITFSLFIVEEAFQTVMFGTWAAKSAQDWPTVLAGADLMADINSVLYTMVCTVGWMQPLAFISYKLYSQASDYYIRALLAEIFAHEPKLLVNRVVQLSVRISSIRKLSGGLIRCDAKRFYIIVPAAGIVIGKFINRKFLVLNKLREQSQQVKIGIDSFIIIK
jgi:hypothetical protein